MQEGDEIFIVPIYMERMEVMIITKKLNLGYKKKDIIRDGEIEINEGEFCVFWGDSGSGKSSLLKALAGMMPPKQGDVFIDDNNLYLLQREKRCMIRNELLGFFPQFPMLIESLTVENNIKLPFILNEKKSCKKEFDKIIDVLGIRDIIDSHPSELSGGEQKRVELARVFLSDRKYYLLDEPTANLDQNCINNIISYFDFIHSHGKTLVVSTHDIRLLSYADKLYKIKNKKLSITYNSSEVL